MKGHPIIGAICGFLFGSFLGVFLLTAGVLATDSVVLAALPFVFLVLGIVIAAIAPFKRSRLQPAATAPPQAGFPPPTPTPPTPPPATEGRLKADPPADEPPPGS